MPGAEVILEFHPDAKETGRKTEYSLIAVYKGSMLINMDSQAPNQVAAEWLTSGGFTKETGIPVEQVRREVRYGNSRFDFYLEQGEHRLFLEVKGVTLEEDGVARFPDAPTERGVKHVEELIHCMEDGYEAGILFVIQMKGIRYLEPNDRTHPAFGEALRRAEKAGVQVLAVDCQVTPESIRADQMVEVRL